MNGTFYNPTSTDFVHCFHNYSVEAGVIYKGRLLIGIGAGYSNVRLNGVPRPMYEKYTPVYADLKYYLPIFKWIKVFGGIEMGCDFRYLEKEKEIYTYLKDHKFLCYPQTGILLQLYKSLGIEVSYGYRSKLYNSWMPTFSIVF